MGVSFYWFSIFVDDSEYKTIAPLMAQADENSVLSKNAIEGIEFWRENPDIMVDWMSPHGYLWNEFSCAFILEGYEDLATPMLQGEEPFHEFMTESRVHRFIITSRITPVSILWYGLGSEVATKLPGRMGNMLLHRDDVRQALEVVREESAQVEADEVLSRAMNFAQLEVEKEKVIQILSMLSDGLEKALEKKSGILFVSRTQL